jgi:acetate kinase
MTKKAIDCSLKRSSSERATETSFAHFHERFFEAALLTTEVEQGIEACAASALLHNVAHLSSIRAGRTYFSDRPQVVVFDTPFHQPIPEGDYLYALPYKL